eukprot:TRINITY_DN69281_c0_g1_i1.p1 TRINITY_DN69281_c0_g1~~TRINITY_DN69281_c0_g1_i1.p1  ORF type:complete len:334 (+),score=52.14 TRINITY_DN69281_c0_g1_i1:98-1099(+)
MSPKEAGGALAANVGTTNVAENGASAFMESPLTDLIEGDARRKLCGGRVLLRIRLASDEVASLKEPPPLFNLAPRLAYLPFLFNDVYEHFQSCLPPKLGQPSYEIWFDCNDVALKWQYPLGVLCDLLVGQEVPTPLDLTVHFRCCPTKEVMPFFGIADFQRVFMSSFRQAVFLNHKSAAPFMKLQKTAQTQLWDSIAKSSVDGDYSEVLRQLLCKNLGSVKSLAVRLHFYGPPHEVLLQPTAVVDQQNGRPRTVGAFLLEVMPPLFDDNGRLMHDVEVMTQGVCVPLETPLYWLALHMAYLDQFIHLVVRVPPNELEDGGMQPQCSGGGCGGG